MVPLSVTGSQSCDGGTAHPQCDLEANEGILTAMFAASGEVHYALHTGARGAPKLISPTVAEEGGDSDAWLGARCVLVRCAMPLQLRLYGIKVRRLGAGAAHQYAGWALHAAPAFDIRESMPVWDMLGDDGPKGQTEHSRCPCTFPRRHAVDTACSRHGWLLRPGSLHYMWCNGGHACCGQRIQFAPPCLMTELCVYATDGRQLCVTAVSTPRLFCFAMKP